MFLKIVSGFKFNFLVSEKASWNQTHDFGVACAMLCLSYSITSGGQ